ncbi:MAG: glycosyltransferase family protein [Nitrososphaerales archaeon]
MTGNEIIHIGSTAGIPIILAKELRHLGYAANEYSVVPDYYFDPKIVSRFSLYLKLLNARIVHFHGRSKELPLGINSRKVVFHYHGDDLRHFRNWIPHKEGALHLASSPDLVCGGYFFDKRPSDVADNAIKIFPNPVEIDQFVPIERENDRDIPILLHSPEHLGRIQIKGTAQIREYLKQVEADGYKFKYVEYTKIKHRDMHAIFRTGDIVIDQVNCGWHGSTALEALAMGRPVVVDIRWNREWLHNEDIFFKLADIPNMLSDKDFRYSKRQKGMEYVRKYHASDIVAKQLVKEYESTGLLA